MKFFMPACTTDDEAVFTYNIIKSLAEKNMGKVTDRKIFRIEYQHNGINHEAEVGKVTDVNGEIVVGILESFTYFVCTATRGACGGATPIMVGKGDTINIENFEK